MVADHYKDDTKDPREGVSAEGARIDLNLINAFLKSSSLEIVKRINLLFFVGLPDGCLSICQDERVQNIIFDVHRSFHCSFVRAHDWK